MTDIRTYRAFLAVYDGSEPMKTMLIDVEIFQEDDTGRPETEVAGDYFVPGYEEIQKIGEFDIEGNGSRDDVDKLPDTLGD
jgi:hypothetical protein|tara:strand:- start:71 stop:313 length:243 start_codon:yes stop_codon:yes gene_type:complete